MDQRVAESFPRQRLMSLLGARLVTADEGTAEIELGFREDLTQQHGYLHAAVMAAIVDSACGYAALTVMPPGSEVLSVEFKVNMLAPAMGETFLATGRVARAGRTLVVTQGEVCAIQGEQRRTVMLMQATMMRVEAPT